MKWIDAHTHLEMIEQNTAEVVTEASNAGVSHMITIGCHPKDFQKVLQISGERFPNVAATLGVHPHDAKLYNDEVEKELKAGAQNSCVIGIGEIGLDYYYNHSDPIVQKEVFAKQIAISVDLGLPFQVHTRDAEDDTIAELKKWKGKARGMIHCFTGTQKLADAALDLGFFISVSGVVTFKNSEALRDVVKTIPVDRLLTETDAPFLAPVPMRGKKNVPAFMVHTAKFLASLKGLSESDFQNQVQKNVKALYPKWGL